jgi:hypothetical protein
VNRSFDTRARRRIVGRVQIAVVALFGLIAATVAFASPASAAGTWGAGNYGYLDGLVCTSGPTTSPLADWDFGGGHIPAFLTRAVTSTSGVDSAALPFSSRITQSVAPVATGEFGLTAADIATFAYLFAHAVGAGATNAAEVAQLVLERTDPGAGPTGCLSESSAETTLLNHAAAMAGPYRLTLHAAPSAPGQQRTVSATVLSQAGNPVPGVTVTFSGAGSASAVTNTSGIAAASISTPVGSTASTVAEDASVALPVSLVMISGTTSPTATSPSGFVAPAIAPAAPANTTATTSISLDQTANPVLTVAATSRLATLSSPITPAVSITGLNGHSAAVQITVYGPVDATAGRQCTALPPAAFASASVATTAAVQVAGDGPASAPPWLATRPGCYAIGARLTTNNAKPNVTRTLGPAAATALVVLDIGASLAPSNNGTVGVDGQMSATVAITGLDGASATVSTNLVGPATNRTQNCTEATFSATAQVTASSDVAVVEDGRYSTTSGALHYPGCYRVTASMVVTEPGVGTSSVAVPLTSSTDFVAVVDPSATQAFADSYSVSQPSPFTATTVVSGLYGKPAHLAIRTLFAPMSGSSCTGTDWSQATIASTGPSTEVTGSPGPVTAESGPTGKPGCYAAEPIVTMDDNSAITSTTPAGGRYSVVAVGASVLGAYQESLIGGHYYSPSNSPVFDAAIGMAVVILLLMIAVSIIAFTSRNSDPTPDDRLRFTRPGSESPRRARRSAESGNAVRGHPAVARPS